jgi:hypothetical protein
VPGRNAPPPDRLRPPDFLCIGAQKAGTTWLAANLSRHPSIWLPPFKELQYFNGVHIKAHAAWTQRHRDKFTLRVLRTTAVTRKPASLQRVRLLAHLAQTDVDDDWYRGVFAYAAPEQICGEITPEYALLPPEGIDHILRLSPHVRVILMMRDPIERSWSHLRMLQKRASKPRDLLALASDEELLRRNDYPATLAAWGARLPPDRLTTVFMEEVVERPQALVNRITNWLGAPSAEAAVDRADKVVHEGAKLDIPPDVYAFLKDQLSDVYDRMAELFPAETDVWRRRHF